MPNFPPVKQPRVPLSEGETVVIQADDPKYDRGLVVKLTGKGGYDMAYWYDQPDKLYPAEIKVDGTTITKDGLVVHIGYHPELAEYVSATKPVRKNGANDFPEIGVALGLTVGGAYLGRAMGFRTGTGALVGLGCFLLYHTSQKEK